ncbi:hypothetical protein VPNG_00323 [Cytospora leucostoma]|uniref:dUTPase-like domain-containing protein n=1 Tax=Cytospora leucostoma TaxID=1230097 RepID=A0A423XP90_9PEZI|nr:hypothetical protein VPNG_00323 [Cytospora leucostoma]
MTSTRPRPLSFPHEARLSSTQTSAWPYPLVPVLEVNELEESVRGAGGFGSTGGFASQVAQAVVGAVSGGAAVDGPSDAVPAAAAEKPSS